MFIQMTARKTGQGVNSMSQASRTGRNSHRRFVTAVGDALADISYAQRRLTELNRPWARPRRSTTKR
ncbi:MAG TPA: hypothetical protein VFE19_02300 [Jatrophihabitantaceae bacterium]|nr:hypothetical protein [Jatrophihabitantaceae bacterium]